MACGWQLSSIPRAGGAELAISYSRAITFTHPGNQGHSPGCARNQGRGPSCTPDQGGNLDATRAAALVAHATRAAALVAFPENLPIGRTQFKLPFQTFQSRSCGRTSRNQVVLCPDV